MTRIALFQATAGIDPAANARALAEAIEQAAAGAAEMLFTPEMTGLLDRDSARAAKAFQRQGEAQGAAAAPEAAGGQAVWAHVGAVACLAGAGQGAHRPF